MVKSSSCKPPIFSIRKVKYQRKWRKEEDDQLIRLVKEYKERNWKEIASHFVNKKPLQCFSRYKRIMPGIKKGSWKKEEDDKIRELVKKLGSAWAKISKEFKTRNGKQIRDRYLNVLDPKINKKKFTEEEDLAILTRYLSNGPKWKDISNFLTFRTADLVKNRFYSSIKKRFNITGYEKDTNPLVSNISGSSLSNTLENNQSQNIYSFAKANVLRLNLHDGASQCEDCGSSNEAFYTNFPIEERIESESEYLIDEWSYMDQMPDYEC